jgi:hypothetical protein
VHVRVHAVVLVQVGLFVRDVKRFVASENGSLPEDLNISAESKKVVHQAHIHTHAHTHTLSLSLSLSHTHTHIHMLASG